VSKYCGFLYDELFNHSNSVRPYRRLLRSNYLFSVGYIHLLMSTLGRESYEVYCITSLRLIVQKYIPSTVFAVYSKFYGGGRLFGTHDKQNSATSPTQRFFSRQLLFRRGLRNPDIRSLRIASCRIDAGVGLIRLDINSVYWDRRSICLGNLEGSSGWNGFILVTITNNHSLLVESWLGWYVYINSLTTARKAGKPGINTTEIGSEK